MTTRYDIDTLSVQFKHNGEIKTYHCQGLPSRVAARLMLVGVRAMLWKAPNPDKKWEKIRTGSLFEKSLNRVPKTVLAYAHLANLPVRDAWEQWRNLDASERMEIRKSKEIRRAMIDL